MHIKSLSENGETTECNANLRSLFDIQVNGFAGVDFQQLNLTDQELRKAVDHLAIHQTKRFFLTLTTDSIEALTGKLERIEVFRSRDKVTSEAISGYHIEGPWISSEDGYRGAHSASHIIRPKITDFDRLQNAAHGRIRLVTLAPEISGAIPFIRQLVERQVEVSLGHTQADAKAIDDAITAGARFCTHLGNAVPAQLPRHDNVMQRLLARDELYAFFIPDGLHLPPATLQNFVRAKPPGKALFCTDCMAGAGTPPGLYTLGDANIDIGLDRIARFPGATNFAGSTLTPDQGIRNVQRWLNMSQDEAREKFSTAVSDLFTISLPVLEHQESAHE